MLDKTVNSIKTVKRDTAYGFLWEAYYEQDETNPWRHGWGDTEREAIFNLRLRAADEPSEDRVNETSPVYLDRVTEIDCSDTVDLSGAVELLRRHQETDECFAEVGVRDLETTIEKLFSASYSRRGVRILRDERTNLIAAWRRLADLIQEIPHSRAVG